MIPTMASPLEMEAYVANVISLWHQATADQLARGRAGTRPPTTWPP
jgi:hypothetical protein